MQTQDLVPCAVGVRLGPGFSPDFSKRLMAQRITAACVLMLFLSGVVWAVDPAVSAVPVLPATTRGQTVTVQGDGFPAQGVKVFLRKGTENAGDKGVALDATVAADGKSLSFKLPPDHFDTGRYLVYVAFDSTELPVPGDLNVLPDQAAKVEVDSIFPGTVYPSEKDDGYDFDISGTNLGRLPNHNALEVVGEGAQPAGTPEECQEYSETKIFKKVCLSYEPGLAGRRLSVTGFHPARYAGSVGFRLRVNGNVSEPKQVTFSRIGETGLRLLATAVAVFLTAAVLALVWKGIGVYRIAGQAYSPAAAFFLDKETNSYSLSKFQLIAWTGVAVFSYVFVFSCRILVQGDFSFPAIPGGWPTLLGISAGTTVAAVGITSSRGSKGAGPISPSMADFISSGGLVASDRFQFFVWTLVGCLGFLALVLSPDPATLKDLPDVPQGFQYLMGISAAGYLGGKVVRLPGPVVSQLLVTAVAPAGAAIPAAMTITLKGKNLSKNALVKVDDDTVRPDQFALDVVKAQDQAPDPSFCTDISLTLKDADSYVEGTHTLTLTNPDGQMASMSFPVDPLAIDPKQSVPGGTQPAVFDITGKNFADRMTGQWTDAAGNAANLATGDIKKSSDTKLTVTLTPGSKEGQGKLVLISAISLKASASINVTAPCRGEKMNA